MKGVYISLTLLKPQTTTYKRGRLEEINGSYNHSTPTEKLLA